MTSKRGARCAALVAVAWALGTAGAATAMTNEVRRYLNSAKALFENLEYEKALKQIERAKSKASGAEDDAMVALYEGIVSAEMGKDERAVTAFKTGLSLDINAKLPLEVSPKVERIFESARENVKKMLGDAANVQEPPPVETPPPEKKPEVMTPPAQTATQTPSGGGARRFAWVPAAAGVALGAGGAYALIQAKAKHDALVQGTVPEPDAAKVREDGKTYQTVGFVLVGAGVACLATAGAMFAFGGPSEPVQASVASDGRSVAIVFSGKLP
jgi:hypothetical protein